MNKNYKAREGKTNAFCLYLCVILSLSITSLFAEEINEEGQAATTFNKQNMDPAALRSMLAPFGWQVMLDDEGGIILIPGSASTSPPLKQDAEQADFQQTDVDKLRSYLVPYGWNVEQDSDGSIILIPGRETEVEPAPVVTAEQQNYQQLDVETLREMLAPHSLNVERDDTGGIVLIPQPLFQSVPDVLPQPFAQQWTGIVLQAVAMGEVPLPIDTWQKVNDLSQAWLSETGYKGLSVGKIREVNKVYIISIVTTAPPYSLQFQLIIRISDGHIFPVS